MQPKFRHIALIGKYQSTAADAAGASSRQALEQLILFLQGLGCQPVVEAETARNLALAGYTTMGMAEIGRNCDLCLVMGGDGTMLGSGRQLAPYGIPLIGINHGRLGFINDIALEHFQSILYPMLCGDFQEDERSLMQAKLMRGSDCIFCALAMNDVVVNRNATSGMVELRVEVDGHFVANQRADGLIVATPTGSTAYALSAGGPLLHPCIAGWVLVPIAPHTLSNRPIVLANSTEVAIEIVAGENASANFDMQSLASLMPGDRIVVTQSTHKVRFLHPKGWSYFDTLRQKLHWNEGVH